MPVRDLSLSPEANEKIKRIGLRAEMVRAISAGDRPLIELNLRAVHKHLCPLDLDLMLITEPRYLAADLATIKRNFDPQKVRWINPHDLPVCRKRKE